MEKDFALILHRLEDMESKIKTLTLQVQMLDNKVKELEEGSLGTGIYLDGCPEYARDYINKKGDE